jgi:hypothetical protein
MKRKSNQTQPAPAKRAPASTASKLLAAASLLGVSLGVSAAVPPNAVGLAANAKDAAAGEKLLQSVSIKWGPEKGKVLKESKQQKVQSNQIKWKPRKPRRTP